MTQTGDRTDLAAIVEASIEAYNAQDFDRYRQFLSDDFYFCHHNRGFEFRDADGFVDALRGFVDLVPDRHLGPAVRVTCQGPVVVRQQTWTGTAAAEFPGVAAAGDAISIDLCTVLVFDGDRISEYHDYG